ncbi:hypothetical protein SG35_007765 [Thalassomonas actiniarum]|uniref:Uncharacterized protein n=1 Tax=Thalassomonas actiniarum TaxID=485447 RepID=A0AAE9YSP7_9GAMM|nr:hypothetical protein SG35_007765 [Thalassomonas actiniarum]
MVELLIAVAILSALLFTGSFAYQMLANRWGKELGEFNTSVQSTKSLTLLDDLLRGVQPFIVIEKNPGFDKPAFFFIGHNNSLLSISRSGIFSSGYPEIFRLTVQVQDNGLHELIYQSVSSQGLLLLTAQQEIVFEHQITLLKDFDEITFSYSGWDGFMEYAERAKSLKPASWREKFSGIDNQLLPEKMRVYAKKGGKVADFNVGFDQRSLRYLTPYIDNY